MTLTPREWRRCIGDQTFLISTSRELLPHEFVQRAFGDPAMYWAKPFSPGSMKQMLDNSCTLGLYKVEEEPLDLVDQHQPLPIGLARLITDYTTFAYLTDVFVTEEFRKLGLGKWLIACCREVVKAMPELRRMMLVTSAALAHPQKVYQEELGMRTVGKSDDGVVMAVRGTEMPGRREW